MKTHFIIVFSCLWGTLGFIQQPSPKLLKFAKFVPHISARVLEQPSHDALGNFYNRTVKGQPNYIQCFMASLLEVDGKEYGVGYPTDVCVQLMQLSGNEMAPLTPNDSNYLDVVDYVASELSSSDITLQNTPVGLTVSGEFEDEFMNEPLLIKPSEVGEGEADVPGYVINRDEQDAVTSVEEYMNEEGIDPSALEETDDIIPSNPSHENRSQQVEQLRSRDKQTMRRFTNGTFSRFDHLAPDITPATASVRREENYVEEEDEARAEQLLEKAHAKADKIASMASDVSMMGSFRYRGVNYHLVRLLQPLMLVGVRNKGMIGYYFDLLGDNEAQKVECQLQ